MRKLYLLIIVLLASLQATNVYARQIGIDPGGDPWGGGNGYTVDVFGNGTVSQNSSSTYYAYYIDEYGSMSLPPFGLTESWLATNGAYQDPFGGGYGFMSFIFPNQGVTTIMYEATDFYDYYYDSFQVTVTSPCSGVSPTASNISICGGSPAVVTANNAPTGFTYQWYDTNGTTPLSTNKSYTVPQSLLPSNGIKRLYLAYRNTATGCFTTKREVTISVTAPPIVYDLYGGGSSCFGGEREDFFLSGSQIGVSYTLKRDSENVRTLSGTGGILNFGKDLSGQGGVYTVMATKLSVCNVQMNGDLGRYLGFPPQLYSISGNDSGGCESTQPIEITLNNSRGGELYQLAKQETIGNYIPIGDQIQGTNQPLKFYLPRTQSSTGTYKVIASNSAGCTLLMDGSVNIVVRPRPQPFNVGGGGIICTTEIGSSITVSGSETNVSYILKHIEEDRDVETKSGNGSPIVFTPQIIEGTYSVRAVTTNGCTRNLGSANIIFDAKPSNISFVTSGAFCASSAPNITLSSSQNNYTYELLKNGVVQAPIKAGTGGQVSFGVQTSEGNYTIRAKNPSGTCSTIMSNSVIIKSMPTMHSLSEAGSYCYTDQGIMLQLNGSQNGTTYDVYNGSTKINAIPIDGTGVSLDLMLVKNPGSYTVVANRSGCVSTMVGTVTINDLPTNQNITGSATYCQGDVIAPITLTASQSGVKYKLFKGATPVDSVTSTGTGPITFVNANMTAGTYTVSATNSNNCTRLLTGSATITVNPLPSDQFTISDNSRIGAGFVSIKINDVESNITYRWYATSSSSAILHTGKVYAVQVNQSNQAFRYVEAVSSFGCVSERIAVPVTVYPLPQIQGTNNGIIHVNNPVTLSLQGTFQYQGFEWYKDGEFLWYGDQIEVDEPGEYTVKVFYDALNYTSSKYTVRAGILEQNLNFIKSNKILKEGIQSPNQVYALSREDNEQSIQYFDGLGRLMQTVSTASSPTGHDIVIPTVYDALGREAKKYLPMVSNQSNGFYKSDILTGPTGTYTGSPHEAFYSLGETAKLAADEMPYATTIFEPSPLNRPLKQGNPGAAWQADGTHAMSYVYAFNQAQEVLQFSYDPVNQVVTAGAVGNLNYYAANQLKADQMIDEGQTITISYVDKMGKTLAKKIKKDGEETMTYYVYDVFDQLAVVIPPQAVKLLDTQYHGQSVTTQQSFLSKWAYRYTYDGRKRMITKEVPGAGKTYMVYDKRDRLVLTQDAEQRKDNQWLYTKYDGLNRAIMTGMYQAASVMSQVDMAAQVAATISERYIGAGDHGYSNDAFPTQDVTVYTVSYYDDYQFKSKLQNTGGLNMNYSVTHLTGLPNSFSTRTINLVTGSKERVLATEKFIEVVIYYDERQRVVQVVKNNHLDEEERSSTRYKNLINPQVMANKTTYGGAVNITRGFQYDPAGRLLNVQHQVNNGDIVTLTANEYNALGEVVTKHQHGTFGSYAQSIDYRYNIRGWLTRINHADLRQEGAAAADYFGMELGYDDNLGLGSQGQYNGNISAMKWSRDLGDVSLGYGYSYDFLNRLTNADLRTSSNWSSTTTALQTGYSYDANGNIMTLNRRDQSGTLIDELVYDYGTTATYSNQLLAVTDNSQNDKGFKDGNTTNDDYVYDSNGNLIADLNKNIVEISYNYLNLPDTVYFGDGRQINYLYSATGQKLQQWSVGPDTDRKTDYTGELVYESDTLQLILHEEGRITFDNGLSYEYFLKDHLGNVRVSYTTNPSVEVALADLEQTPDDFGDGGAIISNSHYNSTPDGNQSLRLSGVEGEIIGLSKSLQVMAGDTVKLSVKAIYPQIDPGAASTNIGSYMAAGFLNSFGIERAPEQSDLYELFGDLFMSGPIFTGNSDTSIPRAYLNYLVFDEQMTLVDMGFRQVSAAGQTDGTTGTHETLSAELTISKSGFVFVYLSNESGQVSEVFFDDMRVELAHGPLLQETGYYPFGLETYQSNASGMTAQRYLYNGKEKQEETSWLDYGARMYMADIGRWGVVDKLSDDVMQIDKSVYQYSWNNPVNLTDPDGNCPWCFGAVVGGVLEVASQMIFEGKSASEIDPNRVLVAMVAGAASGGLSNAAKFGKTAKFIGDVAISAAESAASQAVDRDGDGKIEGTKIITEIIVNSSTDALKFKSKTDFKYLENQADRTKRISNNDPKSSGRKARAEEAQKNLQKAKDNATSIENAKKASAAKLGSGVVDTTKKIMNKAKGSNPEIQGRKVEQDNTRVEKPIKILKKD